MILGSYDDIILVCGNHGEDYSNEMEIKASTRTGISLDSTFYVCPRYVSIYGNKRGVSCNNRVSTKEYEKILSEINSYAYDGSEEVNVVGLDSSKLKTWRNKSLDFKVIGRETDDDGKERYIVSVLNRAAMAR